MPPGGACSCEWTKTAVAVEKAESQCYVAKLLNAVTDPIGLAALGTLSPDGLIRRARNHNKYSKPTKERGISAFPITRAPDPALIAALAITLPLALVFKHFLSLCLSLYILFAFSPSSTHHSYEIAAWIVA